MKSLLIAVLIIPFLTLKAKASGCDWNMSGLELISSMDFYAEGELKCVVNERCIFEIANYNQRFAIKLFGSKLSKETRTVSYYRYSGIPQKLVGQIKKYQEYGSCYNDFEIIKVELVIDGETYSEEISAADPYHP